MAPSNSMCGECGRYSPASWVLRTFSVDSCALGAQGSRAERGGHQQLGRLDDVGEEPQNHEWERPLPALKCPQEEGAGGDHLTGDSCRVTPGTPVPAGHHPLCVGVFGSPLYLLAYSYPHVLFKWPRVRRGEPRFSQVPIMCAPRTLCRFFELSVLLLGFSRQQQQGSEILLKKSKHRALTNRMKEAQKGGDISFESSYASIITELRLLKIDRIKHAFVF